MSDQRRRTRPWGPLKGSPRSNAIAELLREWLDAADLTIDDLRAQLTPEHFANGSVPGRSAIAERFAGVAVKPDFIEAVADVCSADAAGQQVLLAQVRALKVQDTTGADPGPAVPAPDQASTTPPNDELVGMYGRSLLVQERLLRAFERTVELERERTVTNRMVWVLLSMVDKLKRDVETLSGERDRLRARADRPRLIEKVRERLARSETQRKSAEAELKRAEDARRRADRLAEEAAEQFRVLSEEFERLRQAGQPDNTLQVPALDAGRAHREGAEAEADDFDDALAKAAQHLDEGDQRLDHLAHELDQDKAPDNPDTPVSATTQPSDADHAADLRQEVLQTMRDLGHRPYILERLALGQPEEMFVEVMSVLLHAVEDDHAMAFRLLDLVAYRGTPSRISAITAALRARGGGDTYAYFLLSLVGERRSPNNVVDIVGTLRESGQTADAYQVLTAVGRERHPSLIPLVVMALSRSDATWVLHAVTRERTPDEIRMTSTGLRATKGDDYLYLLASTPRAAWHSENAAIEASWPTDDTLVLRITP